jgi:hypothetical protein
MSSTRGLVTFQNGCHSNIFLLIHKINVFFNFLSILCRRDAEKEEKLDRWRDRKYKLDDMLLHLKRKLERVQSTPKNRNDIQEQRDEAKVLTYQYPSKTT